MRVVLDTNVLFSALISPHGHPDTIYRAWRVARFEIVTSVIQLDELRRASRYEKFKAILRRTYSGEMAEWQVPALWVAIFYLDALKAFIWPLG